MFGLGRESSGARPSGLPPPFRAASSVWGSALYVSAARKRGRQARRPGPTLRIYRPRFGLIRREGIGIGRWLRRFGFVLRRRPRPRRRACGRKHRPHGLPQRLSEGHFAFTTIAAAQALLTEMIGARVLGAARANACRFFSTDTAGKWHGRSYFFFPRLELDGGRVARTLRQRCASRSITAHSCSRWEARLTM